MAKLCGSLSDRAISGLVLFLSLLAFIFSVMQVSKCNFFSLSTNSSDTGFLYMGFFSRTLYDLDGSPLGCIDLSHIEIDGFFRAGRAFGTLTAMGSGMSFVLFTSCILFYPSCVVWNLSCCIVSVSALSQMLTFLVMANDLCSTGDCQVSKAGIMGVFNTFVLCGEALIAIKIGPPVHHWLKFTHEATQGPINDRDDTQTENTFLLSWVRSVNIHPTIRNRAAYFLAFLASWIFSNISMSRCTLILIGDPGDSKSSYRAHGLFGRGAYFEGKLIGCVDYPRESRADFDGFMDASRTFAATSVFFLTVGMLLLLITAFTTQYIGEIWSCSRGILIATILCQCLVLLIYGSNLCSGEMDTECIPGGSGVLHFFNIGLLIVVSFVSFLMRPPTLPIFSVLPVADVREGADEEIDIASHPTGVPFSYILNRKLSTLHEANDEEDITTHATDMTNDDVIVQVRVEFSDTEKRTIKEVTHSDGSKTITTTIEELGEDESEIDVISDEESLCDGQGYLAYPESEKPGSNEELDEERPMSFDAMRNLFEKKKNEYHMNLRQEKDRSEKRHLKVSFEEEKKEEEDMGKAPHREVENSATPARPASDARIWLSRKLASTGHGEDV